jgi:hypothetical protein
MALLRRLAQTDVHSTSNAFLGGLIHTMNPAICGSENPFGPGGAQDFVLRREASACHYLQGAPDGRTVVVAANL